MTVDPDEFPLSLANLVDGSAETEFQAALEKVGAAFEDCESYERGKDDVMRAQVVLTVDLERRGIDGWVSLDVRTAVKLPKRKRHGRTIVYRRGKFASPPPALQYDLFSGGGYPPSEGPHPRPARKKEPDA